MVYSGAQWGILVVLAKLGNETMVGQFALGWAICTPVIIFTRLQLRIVQVTDVDYDFSFREYLGLRTYATIFGLLVIGIIVLFRNDPQETVLVLLAVGSMKALESFSDIFYALFQKYERMNQIAISMIIRGIFSIAALTLLIHLGFSVSLGVLSISAVWTLVLIAYDIPRGRRMLQEHDPEYTDRPEVKPNIVPSTNISSMTKLAGIALPLGIVMMLVSLNNNVPKYFVEAIMDEAALGVFAALGTLMLGTSKVVQALGQSATPRLARYYAGGNTKGYLRMLGKLLAIGAVIAVVVVAVAAFFNKPLLSVVYRPEYAEYPRVFLLLAIAEGLRSLAAFLGYGMTAARYFQAQIPVFVLVTLGSVVASYLFIPTQGLLGASYAVLIGVSIQLIASAVVVGHALYSQHKPSSGDDICGPE